MKPQEAMNWCEQFTDNLVMVDVDTKRRTLGLQAMQVCKSALEKQIPKKPTPHKVDVERIKIGNVNWGRNTTIYYCPNCKDFISRNYTYCHKCGQALDWGDTE